MLAIWGRPNSINVQKVLWLCHELGLAYTRVDAGGAFGGTDTPEYRRLNPTGLVPTMDDDGFVLWESNAIVRYLAVKHGAESLFPGDLTGRFDVERWMDWHATTLWPAVRPVFFALVRTPPEQRGERALARARHDAQAAFALLDAHLAERRYLAGENFTIADIPVAIAAYRWYALDIARPALPHLERWHALLKERPAYREHVAKPLS